MQNEMARDSYSYLHFLMVAGIVLVALGMKKTLGDVGEPLKTVPAFALLGGTALYLLGHVAFRYRNIRTINRQRLILGTRLLAVVPLATEVPALAALAAVAAILWAMIGYETRSTARPAAQLRREALRVGDRMKVEMLNAGFFTSPAGIWRRGDDLEVKARFPVPVYLIETDSERILVDTGLNPGAAEDAASHYGSRRRARHVRARAGGERRRPGRPLQAHEGRDHPPALRPCRRARPAARVVLIVIQRREWEAGQDADAIARNFFQPKDYEGVGDRVELVDGDHDLLGDGSVELLSTPGHTPGHQSVRVGEALVIGGDVTPLRSRPWTTGSFRSSPTTLTRRRRPRTVWRRCVTGARSFAPGMTPRRWCPAPFPCARRG